MTPGCWRCWLSIVALAMVSGFAHAEQYLAQDAFLNQAFAGESVQSRVLWLTPQQKKAAKQILGHPYKGLRVRYWASAKDRTAWVLEEVGKERPIQIGVIIQSEEIKNISILAFEESRGWEVRFPFFTDQFTGVALTTTDGDNGGNSKFQLDKHIDGITGATLSVRAVSNTARFALYLQHQAKQQEKEI